MLRIAVSKGRVADQLLAKLRKAGIDFDTSNPRQLIQRAITQDLELVLMKPFDIPTYVSAGIADLGIVGSDVLSEMPSDPLPKNFQDNRMTQETGWLTEINYVNLMPLPLGQCRLCLAGYAESSTFQGPYVRIATKFERQAQAYLSQTMRPGTVIPLSGSVELAPVLGMADWIIDLVESGDTLKAHGLTVLETLTTVQTCLIANPTLLKLKSEDIQAFQQLLNRALER